MVASGAMDEAECPICGTVVSQFEPAGNKKVVPDRRCPTCSSLERHRAIWLFFRERTNLFTEDVKMLHVAAELALQPQIKALDNVDYLTADLDPRRGMVEMDLTDIQMPDDTFDIVYASHVLEHIPDDRKAMREIRRVLRPGGWAMLVVPMWGETTREDPTVTDPKERERLFGQDDHVRMYGWDGVFEERLREAGFDVEVPTLVKDMDPALSRRYRIHAREPFHYCT